MHATLDNTDQQVTLDDTMMSLDGVPMVSPGTFTMPELIDRLAELGTDESACGHPTA